MEVTGILKAKFDTKQVSDKFKSREFVLTTEHTGSYPQQVVFQLSQDKCDLIDKYNNGEELKVSFNLRGREWNSPQGEKKFFNTLDAWKIEKEGVASSKPATAASTNVSAPAASSTPSSTTSEPVFHSSSSDDDLPF